MDVKLPNYLLSLIFFGWDIKKAESKKHAALLAGTKTYKSGKNYTFLLLNYCREAAVAFSPGRSLLYFQLSWDTVFWKLTSSFYLRGRNITVLAGSSGSAALTIISKSLTHAPIEMRIR